MTHKADKARAEKGWLFRNGGLVRKEGTVTHKKITAAKKRKTDAKMKKLGLLSPEPEIIVPARLIKRKKNV